MLRCATITVGCQVCLCSARVGTVQRLPTSRRTAREYPECTEGRGATVTHRFPESVTYACHAEHLAGAPQRVKAESRRLSKRNLV